MEYIASLQNGLDEHKPSLFELLSEQQLSALIPPSLRYLLVLATHRHPRYLLRILNSFDEVYATLSLLVERYYLHEFSGSFTEHFYGLKRERVPKNADLARATLATPDQVRATLRLRTRDVWKNLAVLVALPYLKRKLDESYDIHAASARVLGPAFAERESERLTSASSLRHRVMVYYKWFLRRIYPTVNAGYYFALLAWNMAYLSDSSKYNSPFMWMIGTRLRRLNAADYRAMAALPVSGRTDTGARPGLANSILHPRVLATIIYGRALSSLKLALPLSIFALKFLEWWHASDFARQLSKTTRQGAVELPPPTISGLDHRQTSGVGLAVSTATVDSRAAEPVVVSSSSGLPIFTVARPVKAESALCPICCAEVQTPTVSPYGYVYCYTCIFRWVEGTHQVQDAFMSGSDHETKTRNGRWESGAGRCAVSGKRILGGTSGLRRVMV